MREPRDRPAAVGALPRPAPNAMTVVAADTEHGEDARRLPLVPAGKRWALVWFRPNLRASWSFHGSEQDAAIGAGLLGGECFVVDLWRKRSS